MTTPSEQVARNFSIDNSDMKKPLSELLLPDKTLVHDTRLKRYSPIYYAIEHCILDYWEEDRTLDDDNVNNALESLIANLDEDVDDCLARDISACLKIALSRQKVAEKVRYTKGELLSCLAFIVEIVNNHASPTGDGYLRWTRNFFRGKLPQTEKEFFEYTRDNESCFAKPIDQLGWEEIPNRDQIQAKIRSGRNEPCPCGSGKKYKKCCLGKTAD